MIHGTSALLKTRHLSGGGSNVMVKMRARRARSQSKVDAGRPKEQTVTHFTDSTASQVDRHDQTQRGHGSAKNGWLSQTFKSD